MNEGTDIVVDVYGRPIDIEARRKKETEDSILLWKNDKGYSVSQIVLWLNDPEINYDDVREEWTEDRVRAILEAEAARAAAEDTEEVEMNEWPSDDTSPRHKGQHGTGWM